MYKNCFIELTLFQVTELSRKLDLSGIKNKEHSSCLHASHSVRVANSAKKFMNDNLKAFKNMQHTILYIRYFAEYSGDILANFLTEK